jgi:hypothetical protein
MVYCHKVMGLRFIQMWAVRNIDWELFVSPSWSTIVDWNIYRAINKMWASARRIPCLGLLPSELVESSTNVGC